jgi:hypothetical protein
MRLETFIIWFVWRIFLFEQLLTTQARLSSYIAENASFSDTTDLSCFVVGALVHLRTTTGMLQDDGTQLQVASKPF